MSPQPRFIWDRDFRLICGIAQLSMQQFALLAVRKPVNIFINWRKRRIFNKIDNVYQVRKVSELQPEVRT